MELVAVLHNIRSAHNVGSIFRTADAAGVAKLYLCGITPAPLDRFKEVRKDLAKVALGAHEYVPWEPVKRTGDILKRLKKEGYEIVAVEQSRRAVSYASLRPGPKSRIALVMGNEVEGLPSSILKGADRTIEIPMYGKKESLNVAVAFGVVAFRLKERT